MALNQVYKYSPEKVREAPVPSGTVSGAALLLANNQPAVALTARSDATKTVTHADGVTVTFPIYGIGQTAGSATVATDGSWAFPVTGATTSTPKNTPVYAITSGSAGSYTVTSLTLTVGSNIPFGATDSFLGKGTAARTVVKIGLIP